MYIQGKQRSGQGMIRTLIVGLMMGAAEVVPGVSGGTIAFVSGLYERLVSGISRMTPLALMELPEAGIRDWWRSHDINFLLLLFGAMGVSVVILARGVSYLLEYHPVAIWSFFFGLILASVFVVGRRLEFRRVPVCMSLGWGIAIGLLLTRLAPVEAEVTPLALFAGGSIAVCAWILPGLSGSFVLLTLGLYTSVITAIRNLDLPTLFWLGLGCVVGILAFSRVLSMLLARFHDVTLALLAGFMVGSLVRVWPWQHTSSYQINPDGGRIPVVQEPVLPASYEQLTGAQPEFLMALMACLLGLAFILMLDRFALLTTNHNEEN